MDPRQRIASLLKEWLRLTLAESQAIQAGDWPLLRSIQAAKSELKLPLGQTVEQWRAQDPAQAAANPFRVEVTRLLALETQNGNVLAARQQKAREKKKLLEQALFNLRRVRGSYAPQPSPALDSRS
jgi:hypothetical protein